MNYSKDYIRVDADELIKEFAEQEAEALKKYKGKIVQITGKIELTSRPKHPSFSLWSFSLLFEDDSRVYFGNLNIMRKNAAIPYIKCSFDKIEVDGLYEDDIITIRSKFTEYKKYSSDNVIIFRRSKIIEVIPK